MARRLRTLRPVCRGLEGRVVPSAASVPAAVTGGPAGNEAGLSQFVQKVEQGKNPTLTVDFSAQAAGRSAGTIVMPNPKGQALSWNPKGQALSRCVVLPWSLDRMLGGKTPVLSGVFLSGVFPLGLHGCRSGGAAEICLSFSPLFVLFTAFSRLPVLLAAFF